MKKILFCMALSTVCISAYGEQTEYACASPRATGVVEHGTCGKVGDKCTAPNAKTKNSGTCFMNKDYISCPAYDCNDGYSLLLWDDKGSRTSNRYSSIDDFIRSRQVINYGYCAQDSFWERYCKRLSCTCENAREEQCHFKNFPYQIKKNNKTYNTMAYYGKIPCVCNSGATPAKISCTYKWSGTVECNGKKHNLKEAEAVLTEDQCHDIINQETGNIDDAKASALLQDLMRNSAESVKQLFPQYCGNASTNVGATGNQTSAVTQIDPKVKDAQKTLELFTASAKDEASVWKTSEGKFNTTRLASDITAGVVLGTVGGVVTGNIIKKNQVKKGFEALHCTVGGQKVADWGDEFSVGLRR